MKITVDENIPFGKEAFGTLGEVETVSGRNLTSGQLKETEILVVRSVTQVKSQLLSGTAVKFVGTATIGTDHIDLDYLKSQNIQFTSAPGSNAESVAQYVTAALLEIAERKNLTLEKKTIGIIGVGNTGSRVARNAEALGMKVLLNDPPKKRGTGDSKFLPLSELFESDFLSLHVPLNLEGDDKTFHLINQDFFNHLQPECHIINSSRGPVIDNSALEMALSQKMIAGAVLDVWEKEPGLSKDLLELVDIGTPHIAGYSYDGKVRGTEMIYAEACSFLNKKPNWLPELPAFMPEKQSFPFESDEKQFQHSLHKMVQAFYNINNDDQNLRKILELPEEEQDPYFDHLRKTYAIRREFPTTPVSVIPENSQVSETLDKLQFLPTKTQK
jgi:erythronate-4-phosphate dehydrogenase